MSAGRGDVGLLVLDERARAAELGDARGEIAGGLNRHGRIVVDMRLEDLRNRAGLQEIAVDGLMGAVVAHGNLSVAFEWQFGKPLPLAIPAWHGGEFVEADGLLFGVARKRVVKPRSLVGEYCPFVRP